MEIDAITRNKLKNVVFTSTEPPSTNVLWAKPNGDEVTMYIFKNGSWEGENIPSLILCFKVYLGIEDSELNYAEIDEATANQYQEEWDKALEEKINAPHSEVE